MTLSAAVLFCALAAAPPEPVPAAASAATSTALLTEARRLLNEGQAAAAIEKLGPSAGGGDARVAQLLGVAHYHANDYVKAVTHLTAALPRLPAGSVERTEAVQVLGLSLYLAGRIAEAVPYLEQTRAVAPHNADLAYVLGMAYIHTRQPDQARETWARSFKVPVDSAAAHLLTARMMVRAEFDEAAEVELKKALVKDPRLPHAHFLLGQTALFRGRLDEAIALLRKELELNPGDAMALYRLGDAYSRQLAWDEAVAALQRSAWLNPYYSGPYLLLGRAYVKKGQPAAAEGMLRRAIQYDPNNKAAHYLLGQLLQRAGRTDEARRELEIAESLQDAVER
jgi:tetratricopeptide (TPR) repeat protein